MTIISVTHCCRLLAIDPKTLRRWLALAHLPIHPHPHDARIKGVTRDHLLQVAAAHRRTLADLDGDWPLETPTCRGDLPTETPEPPSPARGSIELMKALTALSVQIAALQQHLAVLTSQLQPQPPATTASLPQEISLPRPEPVLASPSTLSSTSLETAVASSQPASHPTDRRRQHAHVLPVVEYGTQGNYVVICPKRGMLSLQPDSPEWFAWLKTLSSFRFVGQQGRLTAHREAERSAKAPWRAHRQIRNHTYNHRLGQTECLTITVLEQAAAALQSHRK